MYISLQAYTYDERGRLTGSMAVGRIFFSAKEYNSNALEHMHRYTNITYKHTHTKAYKRVHAHTNACIHQTINNNRKPHAAGILLCEEMHSYL